MRMSMGGLSHLTKPWEEYVGFPYDDKVPPRIINGKRVYVEWTGGPVRGTITGGYGHTDAAGSPKIEPGMRWTEAEASALLDRDMAKYEAIVNANLRVAVTQHQFDALADTAFNCPSAIPHVCSYVNAGNWPAAERLLLQYVNSKGERMLGLVHRRNAEITWANTPDDVENAALPSAAYSTSPEIYSPKAEREPAPKTLPQSKVATGSGIVGAGGIWTALQSFNEHAAPIEEAKGHLGNLGIGDQLMALAHSPAIGVAIGIVLVGIAAFIFVDRRSKLNNDHV